MAPQPVDDCRVQGLTSTRCCSHPVLYGRETALCSGRESEAIPPSTSVEMPLGGRCVCTNHSVVLIDGCEC